MRAFRTSARAARSPRCLAPTSSSTRASRVYGLVGIIPFRISAMFFLRFWFLYQFFEPNFGLLNARA
jgi:hypothetical protein